MRVLVNKIGSVTRNLALHRELTLSNQIIAREGAVVVGRVLNDKSVYNTLEDIHGRMPTVQSGDLIVGALGRRAALHGYAGLVPEKVETGDVLQLLNIGGVIGRAVSHNPKVGRPFDVELLGQVLQFPEFQSRRGQPAFVSSGALEAIDAPVTCPVVYIAGTSMNSGKTAAACAVIRSLSRSGLRVGGAKLTGVSLMKDALRMKDYGAEVAWDFTDAGHVTSSKENARDIAHTLFSALANTGVDVIVAEMGDGLLGEYGVHALLEDPKLTALAHAFILCANDQVGVFGAVRLLAERYNVTPDIVSGPATDNHVGTRYVEEELGLPAVNALSADEALGERVLRVLEARKEAKA